MNSILKCPDEINEPSLKTKMPRVQFHAEDKAKAIGD